MAPSTAWCSPARTADTSSPTGHGREDRETVAVVESGGLLGVTAVHEHDARLIRKAERGDDVGDRGTASEFEGARMASALAVRLELRQ